MSRTSLHKIVATMNEMLKADYDAMSRLCDLHVSGNKLICTKYNTHARSSDECTFIRLFGVIELINALVGTERTYVKKVLDRGKRITGFEVVTQKTKK